MFRSRDGDGAVNYTFGGGSARAGQHDAKLTLRCPPSQKGLFSDAPQRHRPITERPARSNLAPEGSQISKSPSMRMEPLSLIVILVAIVRW